MNTPLPDGNLTADTIRRLRHDIRNALSSATMSADILADHADPVVSRHAGIILESLEKALVLLKSVSPSAR